MPAKKGGQRPKSGGKGQQTKGGAKGTHTSKGGQQARGGQQHKGGQHHSHHAKHGEQHYSTRAKRERTNPETVWLEVKSIGKTLLYGGGGALGVRVVRAVSPAFITDHLLLRGLVEIIASALAGWGGTKLISKEAGRLIVVGGGAVTAADIGGDVIDYIVAKVKAAVNDAESALTNTTTSAGQTTQTNALPPPQPPAQLPPQSTTNAISAKTGAPMMKHQPQWAAAGYGDLD